MIESIKNRIWDALKEKSVSLAMLYDSDGKILWHRGRKIKGKSVINGEGFSKTYIEKTIEKTISSNEPIKKDDVLVTLSRDELPYSARILYIKSLLIQFVAPGYYLYIDSGIKHTFTTSDCDLFKLLGQMLGETIVKVRSYKDDPAWFCGTSEAAETIREQIIKYSIEEEPVLLLGETGVGKNHVAELIHRTSGREGRFIVVHTPSLPESLLESELFGHTRGAFTGANETKNGLVQEAERGTLFFDEIAEIPLSFQARLLQLIDVKKYRRLGDAHEYNTDTRIVAATNRHLEDEVKHQRFRKDLFFRLHVLPINIPPLRNRKEDIPFLVEQYQHYLKGKQTDQSFLQVLTQYDWPGNARELINLLKRAGIHCPSPITGPDIQSLLISGQPGDSFPQPDLLEHFQEDIASGKSFWETIWKEFLNREISRQNVLTLLKKYFNDNHNNLKSMSRQLNIDEKEYPRFVSALHKYKVHPGKNG